MPLQCDTTVAGREVLRHALLAMVPQIDELLKDRERHKLALRKQASTAMRESEVAIQRFDSDLAAAIAIPGGSSNDGGLACATTPGMAGDVGGMGSTFNPLVGGGLGGSWEGASSNAVRGRPKSTDDVDDDSDDGIEIEEDEEVEEVDEVVRYARVKMALKGYS